MPDRFDISNVIAAFLRGQYPERPELVREMTKAFAMPSQAIKHLVDEVGNHAAQNNCTPVQTVGVGIMYGLVLGILLERDRVGRSRIIQ
jgi:hypothetical protein